MKRWMWGAIVVLAFVVGAIVYMKTRCMPGFWRAALARWHQEDLAHAERVVLRSRKRYAQTTDLTTARVLAAKIRVQEQALAAKRAAHAEATAADTAVAVEQGAADEALDDAAFIDRFNHDRDLDGSG